MIISDDVVTSSLHIYLRSADNCIRLCWWFPLRPGRLVPVLGGYDGAFSSLHLGRLIGVMNESQRAH